MSPHLQANFNGGHKASVKLDIVVVGAGLGGVTASLALSHAGHRVKLLENAPAFGEVGAGIQCGANVTRLMSRWGLEKELGGQAVEPQGLIVRRWENGQILTSVDQGTKYTAQYGSPYWLLHRADYHRTLAQAAVEAGTIVRFDARVVDIAEDGSSVTLKNGETIAADLIIAADGIKSVVRAAMPKEITPPMDLTPDDCYRAVIDASVLLQDPETRSFVEERKATIWYGPGRHVVGYCIKNGQQYNLVLIRPQGNKGEDDESTTPEGLVQAMRREYGTWEPRSVRPVPTSRV
jgi:salicylate hydroxylase